VRPHPFFGDGRAPALHKISAHYCCHVGGAALARGLCQGGVPVVKRVELRDNTGDFQYIFLFFS